MVVAAIATSAILVTLVNRVEVVIDASGLVWTDGPLRKSETRLSLEEAASIAVHETPDVRGPTFRLRVERAGGTVLTLDSSIETLEQGRWIVDHIQREVRRVSTCS